MTPQEKAEELVNKFRPMMYCYVGSEMLTNTFNEQEQIRNAKQCALICVEPMIYFIESHNNEWYGWAEDLEFWQEVQHEIEKL